VSLIYDAVKAEQTNFFLAMNGIIYCRVSSKEQVEGTSLESQELACREYAERNHITVFKVFVERGESAKCADRPQLLELLKFCRNRENGIRILLVWKVDRLARNVGDHFNIKANLLKQDVRVVSVTEPIDTNPEGKLLETILAGFAQFDNDLRAARTLQGMRRKIQEGLFPWKPPLGYRTVTRPGSKKTQPDVPDQPLFGLLQRAWHDFATGAYTKTEILHLMNARGVRTRRGRPLSKQSLDDMFNDPFYAGNIRDPWKDTAYPGRHIPLVSHEVFAKVQEIIWRRRKSVRHTKVRPELPLRMFARCSHCEHFVSGGLSRGRSQYYPYYRCFNRVCEEPANSRADRVHEEFAVFLRSIRPDRTVMQHVLARLVAAAQKRVEVNRVLSERGKLELRRLEQQRDQLIQMRMENLLTTDEFLIQQKRITVRTHELKVAGEPHTIDEDEISELIDEISVPMTNFADTWRTIALPLQQRFQRTILPHGFAIGKIGTAQMSCLFSTFCELTDSKSTLVDPDGQFWNQVAQEIQELSAVLRMARDSDTLCLI
jgi:DNA invertase Pin-like site-specific DNA recombinase